MKPVFYGVVALGILAATSACAPLQQSRGNLPDEKLVENITPGKHNRAQVARLLGTPSSTSTFDNSIWYYISKRTEQVAFLDPKIVDQKVIEIHFDDKGVVTEVKQYNGETAREVELVQRVTPTRGKEPGILGQLYNTLLRGPVGALGDPNETNEGFVP